ncbi:hypothetical protein MKX72_07315 [Priestia sp. FSL R5-0597]|uniref:hypothetical protein n=1 Tax=Priestia TaxID=2800373 RepID=UPI0012B74208|nr:hypothetical protein [Priestia megaterium]
MDFKNLSKRTYIILGILTLLILLVGVPAFVNYLMSVHIVKVYGDVPAWIGFLGTYIGSILSGAITLIGVILTLKHSERQSKIAGALAKTEARRDSLPIMISHAEESLDIIRECLQHINVLERIKNHNPHVFLFILDDCYNFLQTEESKEFHTRLAESNKIMRNHMLKIDKDAYQLFRDFENKLGGCYEDNIDPLHINATFLQVDLWDKHLEKEENIGKPRDFALLSTISLDSEEIIRLKKLRDDIINNERIYLYQYYDIYKELQRSLEEMLLRFSEEFSM